MPTAADRAGSSGPYHHRLQHFIRRWWIIWPDSIYSKLNHLFRVSNVQDPECCCTPWYLCWSINASVKIPRSAAVFRILHVRVSQTSCAAPWVPVHNMWESVTHLEQHFFGHRFRVVRPDKVILKAIFYFFLNNKHVVLAYLLSAVDHRASPILLFLDPLPLPPAKCTQSKQHAKGAPKQAHLWATALRVHSRTEPRLGPRPLSLLVGSLAVIHDRGSQWLQLLS